jgi:hypothetical protein
LKIDDDLIIAAGNSCCHKSGVPESLKSGQASRHNVYSIKCLKSFDERRGGFGGDKFDASSGKKVAESRASRKSDRNISNSMKSHDENAFGLAL